MQRYEGHLSRQWIIQACNYNNPRAGDMATTRGKWGKTGQRDVFLLQVKKYPVKFKGLYKREVDGSPASPSCGPNTFFFKNTR